MNVRTRWAALGLALLSAVSALQPLHAATDPGSAQAAPPAEAFFKRATLRGAELSPSGRWLAVLTSQNQSRVGIAMIDLQGKEPQRFIQASQSADVNWVQWVNEDWMVFTIEDPEQQRVRFVGSGLMSVRRDGSFSRMLIKREGDDFLTGQATALMGRRILPPNHGYVGLGAPGSDEVVVEEWVFDTQWQYSHSNFLPLNVATGGTRSLYRDGPRAHAVLLDAMGRARVLWHDAKGQTTIWWSDTGDAPWREISRGGTYEQRFRPEYVDGDDGLVVATEWQGRGELRRLDLKTGKPVGEPLVTAPGFSMLPVPYQRRGSGQVAGVAVWTDAPTTIWFDADMKALQDLVDAKLPGRINRIEALPVDKPTVALIDSYSDHQPHQYVLYRLKEQRWQLIGEERPAIDAARMAGMTLQRTRARDGHDLPVWITRVAPPEGAAPQPAPAVVLVHGGPYVRGNFWGWNAQAQFLASRGYVVIEPEFRGSAGFGFPHFKAGWKQWGLAMQDDISDALKYAVEQGWADPARACIVGASYGGYAALMGLVKDPAQYRCGVAFAAVTDLRELPREFLSDMSTDYRDFGFPVLIGNLKTDAERLAATSPVEQAPRIQAPVLLVHGGKDTRVLPEHGERMRDALKKAGKSVEWIYYPDEGHGFRRDENAIDYWTRVERFLARNLK